MSEKCVNQDFAISSEWLQFGTQPRPPHSAGVHRPKSKIFFLYRRGLYYVTKRRGETYVTTSCRGSNELGSPGLVCFNLFFIETCVSAFHNRDVGSTPVR